LDEKCKKLIETIHRVATNTIGYTRNVRKQHQRSQECPDEREAFVQKKARQLNEEASIEIKRHRSIQDS
jgi:hypothetical protein